jgi:hypothetical protein
MLRLQSIIGFLILVLAMSVPAARGAITWGTPVTAGADTDVLNNGTLAYAYQLAGTFSTTVNGVTFQPANTFAAGNIASGATNPDLVMSPAENGFEHFDGGATITGLSSTYTYLLASAGYDNGETCT